MQPLKLRISQNARNLGNGILSVSGFINHQVDPELMDLCGRELARRFSRAGATKVLTAETSGIAPALTTALHLRVPMVFARKTRPVTLPTPVFEMAAPSHTQQKTERLIVSAEYLCPDDRVLIVDDFLAFGHTILALSSLAHLSGAAVVGIGVLIEKSFEGGRSLCQGLGVPIEALAMVNGMPDGEILLE